MTLQVNGEAREFESRLTLAALLDRLGMKQDRVAVELNRGIVPREHWAATDLNDGDQLEIVHFVGGGSTLESQACSAAAMELKSAANRQYRLPTARELF